MSSYLPALVAQAKKQARAQAGQTPSIGPVDPNWWKGPASGPGSFTGGGGTGLTTVADITDKAKQQSKDAISAAIPDDEAAVLRALARARTQMMIRASNGQAGSVSGAGISSAMSNGAAPPIGTGRIGGFVSAPWLQPMRSAATNTRSRFR